MLKQLTFKFVIFIAGFIFLFDYGYKVFAADLSPSDTAIVDKAKVIPYYYKNMDIQIIYAWKEDEPGVCTNVPCQLIKKRI